MQKNIETTKLSGAPVFIPYPSYSSKINVKVDIFALEGDLVYRYQPFRNLRILEDRENDDITGIFGESELKAGQLVPFKTKEFNLSLNNPIDLQVLPSYDGSVNLILNDDLNPPRIINSRFTVTEDKRFKIIDRRGDNDTNIYDDVNIDLQTRLFKNYSKIPYVEFSGLKEGGNLQTGNYSFYFKYTDDDGNESDIIAESGVISVHDGGVNDPQSISGGIANTNVNKIIKLKLSNLDTSYDYINIYYMRESGNDSYTRYNNYVKLLDRKILTSDQLEITITGLENKIEIDQSLLNVDYNMVDRVKTQTQIQNMLFFGNVDKPSIDYKDLTDLSLRITPGISNNKSIGMLNKDYYPKDGISENIEYYNMNNVYSYTGYWPNEIYRFGIVYILKDDSLSPVFNIRGCDNLQSGTIFSNPSLYIINDRGKRVRNYISIDEDGFYKQGTNPLENTKGVVKINSDLKIIPDSNDSINPIGIDFKIPEEVKIELKKYAKGLFFVRLKRIPTTLAQGLTVAVDQCSYLPCIKDLNNMFIMESFLDNNLTVTSEFSRHLLKSDNTKKMINFNGILSPELQLNKKMSTGLFNNTDFYISNSIIDNEFSYLTGSGRHYYVNSFTNRDPFEYRLLTKLGNVQDGAPLKLLGNKYFSASAGMAEEAFKFKYFETKDKVTNARNLIRGLFTGYICSDLNLPEHKIVNIHIPGYSSSLIREYFEIRFNQMNSYYAVGDRYDLNLLDDEYRPNIKKIEEDIKIEGYIKITEYRGDCFINQVTVRMNRNFIDSEVPLNDEIIEPKTWKDNYLAPGDYNEEKDNTKINRADINSVSLGHWVTFRVLSNINLALRSLDDTHSSEQALLGKPRGFFPVQPMSPRSESKMPESQLYNSGYFSVLPFKQHIIQPDVPHIKNIFENRVMFSTRHVNDAFLNGYRVFQGLSYQDITKQYGAITKIFNWLDNLLCIFENGIAMLPINERALILTETNQNVHMYGAGVLPEKETPISVDYGSRWSDSIIRTPQAIYGVDTEAKKIWRFSQPTDSGGGFEILSDFKIQKFLNEQLIMDADEYKPIVGIRNVKTHYDNFKGDVMFTFYDCTRNSDRFFSIVYNERIQKWITRTSWCPSYSENINNIFISFDRQASKEVSLNAYTLKECNESEGIVLDSNVITDKSSKIGELNIKGYDYYDDTYSKKYTLKNYTDLFKIEDNILSIIKDYSEYKDKIFILLVDLEMKKDGYTTPTFTEFIYVKYDDASMKNQFMYKHGQANLFDNKNNKPLPSTWYDNDPEPFEFEFIVNENPSILKIFNNLKIISNKVKPDTLYITVNGEGYNLYSDSKDLFTLEQTIKDITDPKIGRLKGNAHYKENVWDIEIKGVQGIRRQTRLRDKYAVIRLKYTGSDLAVITLIQTFYTLSHA